MTVWNIDDGADATFDGGRPVGESYLGAIRHVGNIDSALGTGVDLGDTDAIITIVSGLGGDSLVTGILGAGTWNNNAQEVIVRVNTDIAGVDNSGLLHGASNSAERTDAPHQVGVLGGRWIKTALRAGNWNEVNGTWSTDPDTANSGFWSIEDSADVAGTAKASGADHEAAAFKFTNRGPGEFTYHYGSGAQPTNDEYEMPYLW